MLFMNVLSMGGAEMMIRICLECGDEITTLFDEYHPEIKECQCCIFNTEIIEYEKALEERK